MKFKEKKKRDVFLDITPIVDTVFNLLIFFALSLNFTSNATLNVNLPKITSQTSSPEKSILTIQLTKNNEVFFNHQPITLERLESKLKETIEKSNDFSIIIQADEQVAHGKVVKIMDICKKCGLQKISIAAEIK